MMVANVGKCQKVRCSFSLAADDLLVDLNIHHRTTVLDAAIFHTFGSQADCFAAPVLKYNVSQVLS